MTDRDVRELLATLDGPVEPRPGFKEELGNLLVRKLGSDVAEVEHIFGLIRRPVARRTAFKAELAATLAGELEGPGAGPTPGGAPTARRLLGRLGERLKGAGWQSAAAAIVLALVASGTVWSNCLQAGIGPGRQLAGPGGGLEAGERFSPEGGQSGDPGGDRPAAPGEDGGTGDPTSGGGSPPAPSGPPGTVTQPPPPDPPPPPRGGEELGVLAFASKVRGSWDIFTMREDGSHRVRLTQGPDHDREPAWSPDGSKIAFARLENDADHQGRIFVMNADGSGLRFLVDGGEPHWSPDGTQIVYSSPRPPAIWVIDADGTDARRLSPPGVAADPAWSPTGDLISMGGALVLLGDDPSDEVHRNTNVYTMRPDGSGLRRLTDAVYACNTSFSPDGNQLAFVSSVDGTSFHVWTMRPDGSAKRQLTEGTGVRWFPQWTPDGTRIVFGLDPDGEPHSHFIPAATGPAPSAIWVIDSDGSNLRRISPPGADDSDPAFRPEPRRKSPTSSDE